MHFLGFSLAYFHIEEIMAGVGHLENSMFALRSPDHVDFLLIYWAPCQIGQGKAFWMKCFKKHLLMYIVKIIRVFESGSNVFWIHPTIHCYWCDKILKYLGCFYLELLAWWWFYVPRYSRLLQNMQIKWSKPSSREKGWFPRTSYGTSATRNPQQISKAKHLLSLLLAANTAGVKRRECLFLQRFDDFVGHAFGYSTQSLMLLSAVFDPLDLISTVCCSQIGPKKTTLIQDKGK